MYFSILEEKVTCMKYTFIYLRIIPKWVSGVNGGNYSIGTYQGLQSNVVILFPWTVLHHATGTVENLGVYIFGLLVLRNKHIVAIVILEKNLNQILKQNVHAREDYTYPKKGICRRPLKGKNICHFCVVVGVDRKGFFIYVCKGNECHTGHISNVKLSRRIPKLLMNRNENESLCDYTDTSLPRYATHNIIFKKPGIILSLRDIQHIKGMDF